MKALTLTQPWASLVALGYKRWETRSWRTFYVGPVAIHAAKGFPASAQAFAATERTAMRIPRYDALPVSAIIATARIVGCQRTEVVAPTLTELERHLGNYTAGRWAWQLADVKRCHPEKCKGALSLWTVPDEIAARVQP